MKTLIILSFVILPSTLKMKYIAIPLWQMALSADKIVYGEITELRENDYILKIISSPTGNTGIIKINRFQDWVCASRWAPYKTGQKVIAFLEDRDITNHIMSRGGEGEMEVKNNSAILQAQIIECNVKTINPDLEINKFMKIMKELRACYGVNKKLRNLPYKKSDCKDDNLYSDKNANSLYICLKKEIEQAFKE